MGAGNYSEQDVKECARAFTGWTVANAQYTAAVARRNSIWPYGKIAWQFEYEAADHDDAEKSFLGETGRFGGDNIVEIIVRHPATARFVGRRLYQFFVSEQIDERGEALIQTLADAYFHSNYEIRSVLRTLFTSEHFKSEAVRYAHYKSPAELVVGTLRLAQAFQWPELQIRDAALAMGYMGQELLNPPSVEGWHEGPEWIDSGTLLERVNFAVRYLDDEENPGVRSIIESKGATRVWTKVLKLAPGTYEYRYIVDGEWRADPDNPTKVVGSTGSAHSILVVR